MITEVALIVGSLAKPLTVTLIKTAAKLFAKSSVPADKISVEVTSKDQKKVIITDGDHFSQIVSSLIIDKTPPASPPASPPPPGPPKKGGSATPPGKITPGNVQTSGVIVVSPVFKLVFLTVVALTVISGGAAVALAFTADASNHNQQAVFETMNTTWKLGLGAIFGLLGGKLV